MKIDWLKKLIGNWWVPSQGSRYYPNHYLGYCWVPLNKYKKMVMEPYPTIEEAQQRCNELNGLAQEPDKIEQDRKAKKEWIKKFPDPFIVCPIARNCVHVDGYLCDPKTCNSLKNAEKNDL